MRNRNITKKALVALLLLLAVGVSACGTEPTVSEQPSMDVSVSSVDTTSGQQSSQDAEEENTDSGEAASSAETSSEETSSTVREEASSEESSSELSEEPSQETSSQETSSEETSSQETSSEETSSQEAVSVKACEHEYEKAAAAWTYAGERLWETWGERGIVYPTCTEEGMTVYLCNLCGDVKFTDFVAPIGHNYEWTVEVFPTPTKTGLRAYKCKNCYGNKTTEVIPTRPGDYSKVDSRLQIIEDRWVTFKYAHLYITDKRSWGAPPEIQVLDVDHAYIVYYDQNGTQIVINEKMKSGGYDTLMITIYEDGTYHVMNVLPLDID